MRDFTGRLFTAAIVASVAASCLPLTAMAYNGWQMQSDQQTINQLAQEGVLNPNQAMGLDQRTFNKANGSWLRNNPIGGMMNGMAPMGVMPSIQSPGQVRKEDRQIDKLERDHVISRYQGNGIKQQLNNEANAFRMQQNAMGHGFNGGYGSPYPTAYGAQFGAPYATPASYPVQMGVPGGLYNGMNVPNGMYNGMNIPNGMYNGAPMLSRVRSFFNNY